MANTVVSHTRQALIIDGIQKFRTQAVCTDKGDLPDRGLFLYKIINPLDPTEDEFIRIATIADVETYQANRDSAMAANEDYWRSYTLTVIHSEVDTAAAAVLAIRDRLNVLTEGFGTYLSNYRVSGILTEYPTEEEEVIESLKQTYEDTVTLYDTALSNRTEAEEAKSEAEATLSTAQADVAALESINNRASAIAAEVSSAVSAMGDAVSASRLYVSQSDTLITAYDASGSGVDPEVATFETNRNTFLGEVNILNAAKLGADETETNIINCASDVSALYNSKKSDRDNAEAALQTASQLLIEAEAAIQEAYDNLESAYNEAKAACPSWVPTTPFPPTP